MHKYICAQCGEEFSSKLAHNAHHTLAHAAGFKGGESSLKNDATDVAGEMRDRVADAGDDLKATSSKIARRIKRAF